MTASHHFLRRPQDASAVWVEDLREDSFQACVKETKIFDGLHKNIKVVSTSQLLLFLKRKAHVVNLVVPPTSGTLQDCAAKRFNNLPRDVKQCTDITEFKRKCRSHCYFSRAKADLNVI